MATKEAPLGNELDNARKQVIIQLIGSRHRGRREPLRAGHVITRHEIVGERTPEADKVLRRVELWANNEEDVVQDCRRGHGPRLVKLQW